MDVSYSCRVTTNTWPENYGATSDEDGDFSYAELEKRMLQLIGEDDDDEDYKSLVSLSLQNPNGSYQENHRMPVSSFPAVTRPPPQGEFDHMKSVVPLPNRRPLLLPNKYGGTGVFIPLPTKTLLPSGKEKRCRGRSMNRRSLASTNN